MRDSLGGILVKGLLGNPILAHFNLFFEIIIETVTPTPSVTATPIVTPTPYPPLPGGGGGSSVTIGSLVIPGKKPKNTKITIRYKDKSVVTYHNNEDKIVNVAINIVRIFNSIKTAVQKITVRKPKIDNIKIKVKKNDN